MSRKRCSADTESVPWTDESTKCPVSADCTAMRAVSTSRISPTSVFPLYSGWGSAGVGQSLSIASGAGDDRPVRPGPGAAAPA